MDCRKFYYYGTSMTRVFRNGEELLLEPEKYHDLRPGDIVAVLSAAKPYVHRVIRILPDGIVTRGDNNLTPDDHTLQPEDEFYLVTHAISLRHRIRKVANGPLGMAAFYQHQARRICRTLAGRILRKLGILRRP